MKKPILMRMAPAGRDLVAYKADTKCRAAVERKFEVAGDMCRA